DRPAAGIQGYSLRHHKNGPRPRLFGPADGTGKGRHSRRAAMHRKRPASRSGWVSRVAPQLPWASRRALPEEDAASRCSPPSGLTLKGFQRHPFRKGARRHQAAKPVLRSSRATVGVSGGDSSPRWARGTFTASDANRLPPYSAASARQAAAVSVTVAEGTTSS